MQQMRMPRKMMVEVDVCAVRFWRKCVLDPLWTPYFGPKLAHCYAALKTALVPKQVNSDSKQAKIICFAICNGVAALGEKIHSEHVELAYKCSHSSLFFYHNTAQSNTWQPNIAKAGP